MNERTRDTDRFRDGDSVTLTGAAADEAVRIVARRTGALLCAQCAGEGTTPWCGKHQHDALKDGPVVRLWDDVIPVTESEGDR